MEKVVISLKDVCPALAKFTTSVMNIDLYPNRELRSDVICDVGMEGVFAEIDPSIDMMLKPSELEINVTCKGCTILSGGFSTSVNRKV